MTRNKDTHPTETKIQDKKIPNADIIAYEPTLAPC